MQLLLRTSPFDTIEGKSLLSAIENPKIVEKDDLYESQGLFVVHITDSSSLSSFSF